MDLFGIKLVGANQATLTKALLSLAAVALLAIGRWLIVGTVRAAVPHDRHRRALFWTRQITALLVFCIGAIALLSIWFDDPARLGSAAGFATAGIAIAAQRVVTAFAGYLVIMRGKTFTVGDRIKMGGVRGDVIALGFLQTRILEMGQPPDVNEQEDPGMWVRARQFSGRIVTVTNDKVFDEPVFNFTREFPFIWEELHIPVPYRADRARAEAILKQAATSATRQYAQAADQAKHAMEHAYHVELDVTDPKVYWRLTDNWVELTVRFVVPEHGIREVKDQMAREILREFEAAGLEVASTTIEISGTPNIRIGRIREPRNS